VSVAVTSLLRNGQLRTPAVAVEGKWIDPGPSVLNPIGMRGDRERR
jgi:hypothetical protein